MPGSRTKKARVNCCVRCYHVYQKSWEAVIGKELDCKREPSNLKDWYAVAVIRDGNVVGHLPRKFSLACYLFIGRGGRVRCEVTNKRRYSLDLPQGGLEIPCCLKVSGQAKEVKKLLRVMTNTQ